MLDAIGGRKFLLTLIVIAVGTAVQILSPHGVTTEFAALLVGSATAFGASNAYLTNKALQAVPQSDEEPAPQPVSDNSAHERIDQVATELSQVSLATDAQIQQLSQQLTLQAQSLEAVQKAVVTATNAAKAALKVQAQQ